MATGNTSKKKSEMKAVPQRCLGNRPNETNERPFEKGKTKHTLILYINYKRSAFQIEFFIINNNNNNSGSNRF